MTRLASVVDVNHVLNIAQRRCGDLGVSVRFDQYADTAYTDGINIVIPALAQPVTQSELDNLYGFVIHECGHHLRPDAFKILAAAQPPEHLCAMYNIIEDDGMERERALAWKGDRRALVTMNSNLISEACARWKQAVLEGEVGAAQEKEPLAALMLGQLSRLIWDDESEPYVKELLGAYIPDAQALVTELLDEGWVAKLRGTRTAHDTWDVACDLASRLYPNNDQQQYEEMRQAGHSMESKRDPSNDQADDARGKTRQEDDDKHKGNDQAEDQGEGRVISWKDAVLSDHNEWKEKVGKPGSIGYDWKGYKGSKGVSFMPTNKINVVDLSDKKYDKENQWSKKAQYMPSQDSTAAFANRIRKYIQAKARSVVVKDRYQGKLDRSGLVRLALPPIEGGEYNKRIFYDQRKHTLKDTAIFILVDWSGSMSGRKMQYAADASQRLIHTFDRVLNVPVALAAFTNGKTKCDIGYIKKFNARSTSPDQIAHRFDKFDHWSSANNDADSVNWAWHEILKRKEQRKLLIVLSDGAPTGCYGRGGSHETLKYITKIIEKDKRVELYGVGICSTAVSNYYANNRVLNDPSEINETLFNIIKEGSNGRR